MRVFNMKQWKSQGNKRRCLVYLTFVLIFVLTIGYGVFTKHPIDKFWYHFVGVLGITLSMIAVGMLMISGVKLFNLLPSNKKSLKDAYEKVEKNEVLTQNEELLFANEEVMGSLFRCGLIIIFIAVSFLIIHKIIF